MKEVPEPGASFPGTTGPVVIDDVVFSGFSACVPVTGMGTTVNLSADFELSISTDGGLTFAPYIAPMTLGGALFPLSSDPGDPTPYVGSMSGGTSPVGGFSFEIVAAPTIAVVADPAAFIGSGWELQIAIIPDGGSSTPSDPGLLYATSPPTTRPSGPCVADLDGDGIVGTADMLSLLSQWGPAPPGAPADFDGDGQVGTTDLLRMLAEWGPCP